MIRIADIYFHKKKLDKPQLFIGRAFDSWKNRKNSFPNEYAVFLSDLAKITSENGDNKKALEYFIMARTQYEKSKSNNTYSYALSLSDIGGCQLALSDAAAAQISLTSAEERFTQLGLTQTNDFAAAFHLKGSAYYQAGNLKEAENQYDKAIKIYSSLGNKEGETAVNKSRQEMTAPLRYNYR